MSGGAHVVPPQLARLERVALRAGVAGAAVCLLGAFLDRAQLFHSYLFAFLFWNGMALGCLSILMLQHLTGGMWGMVSRRFLEAGTRTLPLLALLFLPVLVGMKALYPWADPERAEPALRHVIEHQHPYMNPVFFTLRAVFYYAIWIGLSHVLNRWSRDLDAGPDLRTSRHLRAVSGGGLVLMGLTITFSSVDWAMSLDPRWFSTIYGILLMVGQALSAFCLVIVLLAALGRERPLSRVVSAGTVHDLGKLMLAFVMLWAYMNFSQFLIMWSGNLPEEIPWYLRRFHGGWQAIGLFLVLFHFVFPFLLLLSRELKRRPGLMGALAGVMLFVRLVDLFWLVRPEFGGPGLHLHWLDLAAPLAVGGLWAAVFARELKDRPLLPVGEPEIREALAGEAA